MSAEELAEAIDGLRAIIHSRYLRDPKDVSLGRLFTALMELQDSLIRELVKKKRAA